MTAITPVPVETRTGLRVLRPATNAGDMIIHQNQVRDWVKGALTEGRDYGVIPGTSEKALLKPGAEKITAGFGCVASPRIIEQEVDHYRVVIWSKKKKEWVTNAQGKREETFVVQTGESVGVYRYVVAVDIIDQDGAVRGTGLGSCSSMESKYVDRPRDVENTVLKMARKRAHVAAVLDAFGLSGEFRDMAGEDTEEDDAEAGNEGKPARPANGEGMFPVPFGKSKNQAVADVDTKDLEGALDWNLKTCPQKFGEFQKEARAELKRRADRATKKDEAKPEAKPEAAKAEAPAPSFEDPLPQPPSDELPF